MLFLRICEYIYFEYTLSGQSAHMSLLPRLIGLLSFSQNWTDQLVYRHWTDQWVRRRWTDVGPPDKNTSD